jgi:chromate reductase, NAD(P)H dehydrogenase (quinone)
MNQQVNILGFAGSLRKASYNRALLKSAVEIMPENIRLDIFELDSIPPFNQDYEQSPPEIIKEFKSKIKAADAILIASPEYNYSIPGVLKNAIDWASRPYGDNAFDGKAVAMMSASTGMLGGARAQYHLRQSFVFLNMYPVNKPEVFVTFAPKKFDDNGKLIDEQTKKLILDLMNNLIILVRKMKTI